MTDVSVGFRPPCWCPSGWAPTWRFHTNLYKFGWHTSANSARIKNSRDLRDSWRGCLYCNYLSYPWFLNLFIERLWFLILITWLMKTENCQAQLPLRDLVVVECLDTFARIPFSCQLNPFQSNFLVIFLPTSLVQKGSSIAFAFSWKIWQQRRNIVAWSGCDEIACWNKDGM